ncbi:hypothetical protein I656_00541 [Geobacillus sp. WSUCF1]|nr:hypothetical protein I656_00541 [Geobacillus sp. WSUCF1]
MKRSSFQQMASTVRRGFATARRSWGRACCFFALACRRCDMTHNDGDAAHSIMETTDGS